MLLPSHNRQRRHLQTEPRDTGWWKKYSEIRVQQTQLSHCSQVLKLPCMWSVPVESDVPRCNVFQFDHSIEIHSYSSSHWQRIKCLSVYESLKCSQQTKVIQKQFDSLKWQIKLHNGCHLRTQVTVTSCPVNLTDFNIFQPLDPEYLHKLITQ